MFLGGGEGGFSLFMKRGFGVACPFGISGGFPGTGAGECPAAME